jgi:hypothetical protein
MAGVMEPGAGQPARFDNDLAHPDSIVGYSL